MAHQISEYRRQNQLPAMKSVILHGVTGEYWRFQEVGQHAVSTIEAIAHTAKAAGASDEVKQTLLTLFKLQKYRVMKTKTTAEGRAPRAVEVEGVGIGSWKDVADIMDEVK
jgi:hypothetical protein